MVTLQDIKAQVEVINSEMAKLRVLREQYTEENRKYPNGYIFEHDGKKYEIKMGWLEGEDMTYKCHRLNKDGSVRKPSRVWRAPTLHRFREDEIKT